MLDRILVPLDGSTRAEEILSFIRPLLKRQDAELILVRAVEWEHLSEGAALAAVLGGGRQEAAANINSIAHRLVEEGIRARSILRDGLPAEVILEAARDEHAALIAMTTHGRTGVERWIFGSVAEKILRAADVPVIVVRSFTSPVEGATPPERRGRSRFRRILVPTDGSEASMAVVPTAIEVARLCGSEVAVLSVTVPHFALVDAGFGGTVPLSRPTEADAEGAAALVAGRFSVAGIRVGTIHAAGEAAEQIVSQAAGRGFDLIAMSTHGHSGISRWVFGSVTEKVVRAATVPMLVVRASPQR